MMTRTAKTTIAFGLAGALTMATAIPTLAAPVPTNRRPQVCGSD